VSPELVLVCPQLRLKALAALPDRPWEAFLPERSEEPPAALGDAGFMTAGPIALPSDDRVAVATTATPDSAVTPVDDPGGSATSSVSRLGRNITLVAAALLVGFIAAQFVRQPARPSLIPTAGSSAQRAVEPTSLTSGRRDDLAVARGGYIFGRSGRFQIARDLRTVRMFHAGTKCARSFVIPAMSLRGGSRFSYRGRIRAAKRSAVRVEVAGHFLDSSRVRGFFRAHSAGCDSGKVSFLARLS